MHVAPVRPDRRGAAILAVLVVMFWLTGIAGWLVAHVVWDQRVHMVDRDVGTLARAADAMIDVVTWQVSAVADWNDLLNAGTVVGCPEAGPVVPATVDVTAETERAQQTADAVSRWPSGHEPVWHPVAACGAVGLDGSWRAWDGAPWLLAWASRLPGEAGPGPPSQLMLHVVVVRPGAGRSARTVTIRRAPGQSSARIVAWHAW